MKVFGTELDQLLIQERLLGFQSQTGVPSIVEECLTFLIPAHVHEEGLFRISGMKEDIVALKQKCDASAAQGAPFRLADVVEENCHNISGLLKLYIRELPNPLYPKTLHGALIAAGKIEDESARTEALQDLAKHLPLSNYALLRRLTRTLYDLLEHVEATKMTSANLSTVWAPNLIWDRETETDPTTCLAFSRDINLAIQCTIEAAYSMFSADELLDSMTASTSGATEPKRRSVVELEKELERSNSNGSNTLSGSCVELPRLNASDSLCDSEDSSSSFLVTPRSDGSSSDGMTAATPITPGFEDMLALATASTKKRPRSIWVGSASAIDDQLDSLAELERSSSNAAAALNSSFTNGSSSSASAATPGSAARRSIKRRTRMVSIDKAAASAAANVPLSPEAEADEDTPYAKRRKLMGSTNSLTGLDSRSSCSLLDALRAESSSSSSSSMMCEDSIAAPSGPHLTTTSITAVPDLSASCSSSAAPSPRKSSGIRASLRKSLRIGSAVRSSRASVTPNQPAPEVQLYYYMDSDPHSVALRKLLNSFHIIPREIRNAQNDPMSVEEVLFFAQTCQDIVVVRRTDKAYTASHKISDLSQAELSSLLTNSTGEPRSPAIIAGSTFIVGYDKTLKDIFKYYLHRTKKTATPIRI